MTGPTPGLTGPSGLTGLTTTISGWAVHVPGVDAAILAPFAPAATAVRAHELLGRKGLLAKDPATRLALCAVHRALGLPPGERVPADPPDPATGVAASSNLGNVGTVADVASEVRRRGWRGVSPLGAPNASSNIVASTVAIWFRCGGPNLMVCSGATAGLDALALAILMIRTRRARRMIVVGTEPDDDVAGRLFATGSTSPGPGPRLRAGAAALVVEASPEADAGTGTGAGWPSVGMVDPPSETIGLALAPGDAPLSCRARCDVATTVGELYGAQGVVQLAVAAELVAGAAPEATEVVVGAGSTADGWRWARVTGPGPTGEGGLRRDARG